MFSCFAISALCFAQTAVPDMNTEEVLIVLAWMRACHPHGDAHVSLHELMRFTGRARARILRPLANSPSLAAPEAALPAQLARKPPRRGGGVEELVSVSTAAGSTLESVAEEHSDEASASSSASSQQGAPPPSPQRSWTEFVRAHGRVSFWGGLGLRIATWFWRLA